MKLFHILNILHNDIKSVIKNPQKGNKCKEGIIHKNNKAGKDNAELDATTIMLHSRDDDLSCAGFQSSDSEFWNW